MKLFHTCFVLFLLHLASGSKVLNTTTTKNVTSDNIKKEKDVVAQLNKDNRGNSTQVINNLNDFMKNRTEDFCSFTKLLKTKSDVIPDPEECKKINERFKKNSNFDFINYFGKLFNDLKTGIDSINYPNDGGKIKTIFFVGNTGSGKSSTVQILTGDNTKIYSFKKSISSDYTITDNLTIGTDTITSQTLYPKLYTDSKTRYVLCDNPGFRDTRSSVHEIIATHGMRRILKRTKMIKIVIVSTHSSLKSGMYRDDLPNLLQQVGMLFHNVDKYKGSFYLIGTKAENTVFFVDDEPHIVSDSSIVNGTAHFLVEVRNSMSKLLNQQTSINKYKEEMLHKSMKIIDSLIKSRNGIYNKIHIMRRPAKAGPLSSIKMIQEERNEIRRALLDEDNMVEVNERDFGFPLTDSAVVYLNELFGKMNWYVTNLSAIISEYIKSHYGNLINSNSDFTETIKVTRKMKDDIKKLSLDIGAVKNPGQYADLIRNYSDKHKLKLECLSTLKNISTLNEFLVDLEGLTNSTEYTPFSWNVSLNKISEFIENKEEQTSLLIDIFKYTSSYKFQKKRHIYVKRNNVTINNNTIDRLLNYMNSGNRYEYVTFDNSLFDNINEILNVTLKGSQYISECKQDMLVFKGYFMLLSELDQAVFKSCNNYSKIVILALHTIFIDQDLTSDWFKGKDFIIISPIWEVVGSKTLSVNGINGGEKLPKANLGLIGKLGNNGISGGTFAGIGMDFINGYNLKITASGGDGQDGQDGGDGTDGTNGSNGNVSAAELAKYNADSNFWKSHTEETYVAKGSYGEFGGDAGVGGKGGYGGKKGSAVIHNIGDKLHEITVVAEDGKKGINGKDGVPGRGGIRGCDIIIKKEYKSGWFTSNNLHTTDMINCGHTFNPSGRVKYSYETPVSDNTTSSNNDSPVCIHIMDFQSFYLNEYHSRLSDGITKQFITDMILRKF